MNRRAATIFLYILCLGIQPAFASSVIVRIGGDSTGDLTPPTTPPPAPPAETVAAPMTSCPNEHPLQKAVKDASELSNLKSCYKVTIDNILIPNSTCPTYTPSSGIVNARPKFTDLPALDADNAAADYAETMSYQYDLAAEGAAEDLAEEGAADQGPACDFQGASGSPIGHVDASCSPSTALTANQTSKTYVGFKPNLTTAQVAALTSFQLKLVTNGGVTIIRDIQERPAGTDVLLIKEFTSSEGVEDRSSIQTLELIARFSGSNSIIRNLSACSCFGTNTLISTSNTPTNLDGTGLGGVTPGSFPNFGTPVFAASGGGGCGISGSSNFSPLVVLIGLSFCLLVLVRRRRHQ